jgi:small multidrug resistance pump
MIVAGPCEGDRFGMPYVLLGLAITVEVAATTMLARSDGFTKLSWTVGTLTLYAVSFMLMAFVVRHIPVGVTYAIWSGAGTAAIAAIGVVYLKQPLSAAAVAGIGLIVAGVVLVNLSGSSNH